MSNYIEVEHEVIRRVFDDAGLSEVRLIEGVFYDEKAQGNAQCAAAEMPVRLVTRFWDALGREALESGRTEEFVTAVRYMTEECEGEDEETVIFQFLGVQFLNYPQDMIEGTAEVTEGDEGQPVVQVPVPSNTITAGNISVRDAGVALSEDGE